MRRFIHSSLFRNLFLFCSIFALLGCATTQFTRRATNLAASPSPAAAVEYAQEQADGINRPTSKPYTGELSIFEDPKRDENLQPNRIMDILGIKEDSSFADIGAGSGWFTVRAARRVGNAGIVYAVDINSAYLKYIDDRARRESLPNIRTILGKEDDPLLPAKSIDAVLLLKTYHELAQPIRLLKRTQEAMRAGALLGIIDRNGKGDDHGIDKEVVIKESERAGFVLVNQYDFVKPDNVDYFLVFRASAFRP
ncbi:MAG TPA: methyltransferase domain-containing protein [Pyrinomonadaceae bacterium]|jgi:predicted methyltransferase